MNGQEYLNQISAKTGQKKTKNSKNGILGSKFFWVGVIGAAAFILIMIVGIILNGGKSDDKSGCYDLAIRLNNTSEVVTEYQPNIKSSELRSASASLQGLLTTTSNELMTYMTEKYEIKNLKDASKKIIEQAGAEKEALSEELFNAKINGALDRVYAEKMASEIELLIKKETKLYDSTKNDDLKAIVNKSYDSLKKLYDMFNNFSET